LGVTSAYDRRRRTAAAGRPRPAGGGRAPLPDPAGGVRERRAAKEERLVAEFGTIRNAVRDALDLLRGEGLITPSPEITARLALPDETPVVHLERLRRLNGVPLSLDQTYLEPELGRALLEEDLEHEDVFVLIERLKGSINGFRAQAQAVTPAPNWSPSPDTTCGARSTASSSRTRRPAPCAASRGRTSRPASAPPGTAPSCRRWTSSD